MGKKKKRKRRSDERGNSDSSALSEDRLAELRLKLITTITRKPHRLSRIRRLLSRLDRRGSTINHQDAQGQTLLHLAASCGHNDVVEELLRQDADASIQDNQGNTAAHLAALNSHLLPLTSILQSSHPPDIDSLVNQAGTSIRMATDHMLSNNQHIEGPIKGVESMRTCSTDDYHAVDTTAARDGSQGDNQEEEWQQRLREEYSDGEGGGGVVWGPASGRCDGYHHQSVGTSVAGTENDDDVQLFATLETEDEWAERLWREMQARRRTKHRQQSLINHYTSTTYPAAASGAGLGSRSTVPDATAAEMAAAAAAARQRESDRILQEEQQKDAAWRHKASSGASSSKSSGRMPGPSPCPTYAGGSTGWGSHQDTTQGPAAAAAAAAATLVLDPGSMRDEYEAKWRALKSKLALMKHPDANKKHHASTSATAPQVKSSALILKVDDIPWPIPLSALIPPPSAAAYQHVGRNADSGGGNNNVATQNPNHYKGLLADVLIWGASGVSEVKARLRMEIMRWHPDKFLSRFGALFPNDGLQEVNHGAASVTGDVLLCTAASKQQQQQQQQQILKGVDLVAQQITQLMGSLPLQVTKEHTR
ncbi:hypothetical protein CEUSTIGMA_g10713.t1 [Chlamydomonas eustigma]|uniref:NF-kappa-B inhibitor-like protein 1 n=1 Tax=Chlamydomonas eustigma TaxID=1157962 RepID=A0A250XJN6_9CHLO|nr:hypothetical protein CEUSTIGMA_g10713.t1 [Chlamydomonas eustigma]|eukprot:GAX83287.1 hypothetical protein CEUSTIGMA_g10713.t1 [Chlamydomonas eustigma]